MDAGSFFGGTLVGGFCMVLAICGMFAYTHDRFLGNDYQLDVITSGTVQCTVPLVNEGTPVLTESVRDDNLHRCADAWEAYKLLNLGAQ